jgi:hypothetical protein
VGNTISVRWILNIRNSVHELSFEFRRTDETRRVIIIITIECLLAVVSSWLIDIILSIKYCHRSVAIGDDCPDFLLHYYPLLFSFDLINSMSNILLYCFATKRFRNELERMLEGWLNAIRKPLSYYCHCQWKNSKIRRRKFDDEQMTLPSEISLQLLKSSRIRTSTKCEYIKLKIVTSADEVY